MNRKYTQGLTLLLIVTLLLVQVATVSAQSGPQFALTAGAVSSGGGILGGGRYQMAVTVGQPGGTASGGGYGLSLGLLTLVGPPAQSKIYLPLVSR